MILSTGGIMRVLVSVLVVLFSNVVLASGDSGCGFGSVIISKNSKGLQLLSITTNHSFFSQPIGITFGTSNCSASGIVSNEREKEYFVQANYNELSKNMARGEGESLSAFAVMHGCITPKAKNEFAQVVKSHIVEVIPTSQTSSLEIVSNVRVQIEKNESLKQLCTASL